MQAAIDRGPHKSTLAPDAIVQLWEEVSKKGAAGQARIVQSFKGGESFPIML